MGGVLNIEGRKQNRNEGAKIQVRWVLKPPLTFERINL